MTGEQMLASRRERWKREWFVDFWRADERNAKDLETWELIERVRHVYDDNPTVDEGECVCPDLGGGERGFKQSCRVHGGRTRDDFERATADRAELFSRLEKPASVKQSRPARS